MREEKRQIMIKYDYRETTENSSENQLQDSSEGADSIRQSEEIYLNNARIYFDNAMLPILQDFGKITSSLLMIEENHKNQTITASLKNQYGFDITESCKYIRSLFVLADYIGINVEDGKAVLSLIFDCKDMYR